MDNYKKNEKYKELMVKLKKSIHNDFYYESIFIEYAILEDRTESILRHAKLSTINNKGLPLTLNNKLNKIKNSSFYKNKYINKHINNDLIELIYEWKNKRNSLIHDLIKSTYTNDELKVIALDGYEIVKRINNKSTLVNKYLDNNYN